MSTEEQKPQPQPQQPVDDKDKYLKPYWYPKSIGEQNELLPSFKENVNRGSLLTKTVQFSINFLLVLIPCLILHKIYKIWYSFLKLENGIWKSTKN